MNRFFATFGVTFLSMAGFSFAADAPTPAPAAPPAKTPAPAWQPGKAPLMTKWATEVTPDKALPEYPRPQMVREEWQNLNGLWDYAVTAEASTKEPAPYDGKILVPFAMQSALSGVMKPFDPTKRLWYHRTLEIPAKWAGQRVLLHFGAVSWDATVNVNGTQVAHHKGDYDAFTVDITDALKPGAPQDLVVSVLDPIQTGGQPRGKQVTGSYGIYYTASSGIWQTVWLELVPKAAIDRLKLTPDVDGAALKINVAAHGADPADQVEAIVTTKDGEVIRAKGAVGTDWTLALPNPHLWSFDDPFLYDLKVTLIHGGQPGDSVASYFGMRKIALGKDAKGILRPMLNGKFVFQLGPLDQGFWPDGVYTAPTDDALRYDIEMTKKFGFNTTRKHVKVEPDRWYYWCDKLGLLVWQDMPSADLGQNVRLNDAQAAQFEVELKAMIDGLWNHPCVIQWEVFNEEWGQHDTFRLAQWVKTYDSTRLTNAVSGFEKFHAGDVTDDHSYPGPSAPHPDDQMISVLGEFGGITVDYPGHMWTEASKTVGYNPIGKPDLLAHDYPELMKKIWPLIDNPGLSAAIYTQITDVEQEANGLMTYDRIPKVDPEIIRAANQRPPEAPLAPVPAPATPTPAK